jgi:hypothetical protein
MRAMAMLDARQDVAARTRGRWGALRGGKAMLSTSVTGLAAAPADLRTAKLDMADPHQVARLCSEFACRARDIYIAVAVVGDNVQELRSYLVRAVSPRPSSAVSDLPPLWSSVLHADADF